MHDEPSSTDTLFATGQAVAGGFRFDADVARVFADMISRSVPGYAETVALTGWLSGRYARDDTHLYDLGCSLGATLFACSRATAGRQVTCIGVDRSAAMLTRCAEQLARETLPARPELVEADITELALADASFVALNWTLQFVPLARRDALCARIADALSKGGALVLSEKVVETDPARQAELDRLHLDFKRAQGYSELEIAAKRSAIEDVLVPETLDAHRERLLAAGFDVVTEIGRTLNFATLLAVRL